jgi:hypothetical protein
MTQVAPRSKQLQQRIRKLAEEAFSKAETMVYFLGAKGETLAAVDSSEIGRGELLVRRTQLMDTGELRAVVDITVALPNILQVSMVEVLDGSQTEDVYALVTWPATQRWVHVPEIAQLRWREHWT